MKLILAPMQGLTDVHMRDLLTRIAGPDGYDWCVSEFMRVTDRLLPARTIYQLCPELLTGSRTAAGTPVHVQLLGSEPAVLAENAARVAELGAAGIDLNFGCPAKTVNFHRGGAILLDEPETVHAIVAAVRSAVPASIPVSAKMRLGVNDRSRMLDNAQGIEAAGASWLTVHGRTKADGYRPPAYWDAIAPLMCPTTRYWRHCSTRAPTTNRRSPTNWAIRCARRWRFWCRRWIALMLTSSDSCCAG